MPAARWNAGKMESEAWLREAVPHVCRNSLLRWEEAVKREGSARLAGDYGKSRRGKGRIDSQSEIREHILSMMSARSEAGSAVILDWRRAVNAARPEDERLELPSLRALQRWMQGWKKRHGALFQYMQSPDEWRNRCLSGMGDYYAPITRPNEHWEYDGTPSDVMLDDGRRYGILGVIDVFTRRVKLRVASDRWRRRSAWP